jgi:hypothetical protein
VAAFYFFLCGGAGAGGASEHHLQRDQEQQQSTEYAERLELYVHQLQERAPGDRKQREDDGGDHDRTLRHVPPLLLGRVFRQSYKDRNE